MHACMEALSASELLDRTYLAYVVRALFAVPARGRFGALVLKWSFLITK